MFNSFLICFPLSVVRTAEFLGRKLHLLLHGTCTVHLPEPRLQPYLCGGSFCILWSSFCKTRRERESCLIHSVCFSFKCDFFPTQSSFIFKREFLLCSGAFGCFKKMEILFPAFLFCFVVFSLSCQLLRGSALDVNMVLEHQASSRGSVVQEQLCKWGPADTSLFPLFCAIPFG